jgi:heme exporter protein D
MLTKNDVDDDFEDWWDILRGKSIPSNADPETVAEARVLRSALLTTFQKEKQNLPKPVHKPPESTIKKIYDSIQKTLATWFPPLGGRPFLVWGIGSAVAAVLVLAIIIIIERVHEHSSAPAPLYDVVQHDDGKLRPENPIDTTSKTIYAQKTVEMEEELRGSKFRWEKPPASVSGFSPNGSPSEAAKAFGAGLLTARESLLGQLTLPSSLLPPPDFESWSKTEWANHFDLGRWTFLLWTASEFPDEMPQTFWDKQKQILAHFKAEFEQQKTDEAKDVMFQLENLKIEQLLNKLPDELETYDDLAANLKDLMSFLAPPPMETVQ